MKSNIVMCDPDKMKRIAVTCKCGNRFIDTVPGEVFDGGMVPVMTCDKCKQSYALSAGKLRRVDMGQLGKVIEAKVEQPVDAELHESVETPEDHRAWEMPTSKLVN